MLRTERDSAGGVGRCAPRTHFYGERSATVRDEAGGTLVHRDLQRVRTTGGRAPTISTDVASRCGRRPVIAFLKNAFGATNWGAPLRGMG